VNVEEKVEGALRLGVKRAVIKSQVYELLSWSLGLSLIIFCVSIFFVYIGISTFITRPILSMERVAEKIASGDLTSTIEVKGSDEVAKLGKAINSMAFNLRDMLSKIGNVTKSVSDATTKIADSSNEVLKVADLQKDAVENTAVATADMDNSINDVATSIGSLESSSEDTSSAIIEMSKSVERVSENVNIFDESAHETASSIEELVTNIGLIAASLDNLSKSSEEISSTVNEVHATVLEIEEHAKESVKLAEKVTMNASEKGMGSIRSAIEGMMDIKDIVGSLSEVINILGNRSKDIGKILVVINEVTDQTKLLSLNTAILAAQAGEHGKSFSIVADEIKGMAEKTSMSTKEISKLITSVQKEIRSSVKMASDGIQTVERGMKLVNDVDNALNVIVDSSKDSTEMSKAIQRATVEQARAIRHITEAIDDMTHSQIEHIARAISEQSGGSKLIIDATEKMKDLSNHVRTASSEHKDGSTMIVHSMENVSLQIDHISQAVQKQKQGSDEVVQSMERIRSSARNLIGSANIMRETIRALRAEAESLVSEIQKFNL
jgi:methyl-accepting chemotaxis protein